MPRVRYAREWKCHDCGNTKFDMFMVKDDVWLKIWPSYINDMRRIQNPKLRHGVLCQPCAEKRLGCPLSGEDQNVVDREFWIDPAGVSDSWNGVELNPNILDRMLDLHQHVKTAILERYFMKNSDYLDTNDYDNMARLYARGIPSITIAKIFHIYQNDAKVAEMHVSRYIIHSLKDKHIRLEVAMPANKYGVKLPL